MTTDTNVFRLDGSPVTKRPPPEFRIVECCTNCPNSIDAMQRGRYCQRFRFFEDKCGHCLDWGVSTDVGVGP